jgi:hypothetical protein
MEPNYAFGAHVFAGYSAAAAGDFAELAVSENLAAAVDATQKIGSNNFTAWIRIYDPVKDLIGALQDNGFDVWIVSASAQYIVEQAARRVGIAANRVVGIRLVEAAGLLTGALQGCGGVADGATDATALITYIDGKRCWINKAIYGDTSAAALTKTADPARRPVFGAGDSDTDITFLKDATALKLVINRNKQEVMCNAYSNAGGRWIVNPMFLQPKVQLTSGYACTTSACKDDKAASIPCVDEDAQPIADQQDRVYGP